MQQRWTSMNYPLPACMVGVKVDVEEGLLITFAVFIIFYIKLSFSAMFFSGSSSSQGHVIFEWKNINILLILFFCNISWFESDFRMIDDSLRPSLDFVHWILGDFFSSLFVVRLKWQAETNMDFPQSDAMNSSKCLSEQYGTVRQLICLKNPVITFAWFTGALSFC